MGPGKLFQAVADAGPLIHLHEVGAARALEVFRVLHLPDAVWSETVGRGRLPTIPGSAALSVQRHTVPHHELQSFVRLHALDSLDAGERECLHVCSTTGVELLLTDDLAVREAAKRLERTPVGSLGIIVKAFREQLISYTDAESFLQRLYDTSSLFVTRAIVELALERLRAP